MVDTVKLLKDLIAIPSVNPSFLPAGHGWAGEERVGEFLSTLAGRLGVKVERQKVTEGRYNFLLRLAPRGKAQKRILLAPHLDTVNGTAEQFKPQVEGDRLFGRGACDTKGSVAAMFGALCDLAESSERPAHTEIILAALADEECSQMGSRVLGKSGMRADLAIVGEPTKNRVVTAHKGALWLRLETFGRAAHGSSPELGRNAVHQMARVVDMLETDYATALAKRRHPLLGVGTVSVGAISGGSQPNIVPDHCVIQVDRRTLPGETKRAVFREIQALLNRKKLRATLSLLRPEECPALETDSRLEPVSQFLRLTGQQSPEGARYFCDAAILSKAGIPSVVFGPGDISQAHTTGEWISIKSLEKARVLLKKFLLSQP